MEKQAIIKMAQGNLEKFSKNEYPGRGILVGMSESGDKILQVYWVMGRSPGSRNRILVDDGGGSVRTDLADSSKKPEDTSLIIYNAMAEMGNVYVVSNGHQTTNVIMAIMERKRHQATMRKWEYEPDDPNFTPRITSVFIKAENSVEISVLKKSLFGTGCNLQVFGYEDFLPGVGYCVTTYEGDGSPLPSFSGEPFLLPLKGTVEDVAQSIWKALDDDNKVALAVKAIDQETGESTVRIINKINKLKPDS